jgi:acetylornithine deacetylase/succinyl-diaminopimelate desuccinylase-like protein
MKPGFNLLSLLILALAIQTQGYAQSDIDLKKVTEEHFAHGISLLNELLSMPNDANYPDQIKENLQWCEQQFGKRDWDTQQLETEGFPLLLAEKSVHGAEKTVLIYFHVDGQPVDRSKWNQPDPYQPVLKRQTDNQEWEIIPMERLESEYDPEWRIFARSASDDKGPLAMFLTAWDAMENNDLSPNYNIKVIMDFEEEIGSPNLPGAVERHTDKLAADMMLIMDGPRHQSNRPTLTFGARGISQITLTTYGPKAPQHSGHYGNYAPNPALRMAQLLASMKDEDGRVTIEGFYDGIELTEEERNILAQVPDDEENIQEKLGIAAPDKVGITYQESIQYPSLNIRGLSSGWVGQEARTIVPSEAIAEIDIRLVPESDPERLFRLVRAHIEDQGFHIVEKDPTQEERMKHHKLVKWEGKISYQAFRTPFDSEPGIWLDKAFLRAFGESPIKKRMSGGSIPISPFVDALDIPAVTVVSVNPDNNQHSPNENIRLGNYKEGIMTMLAILTEEL